ncbi:MAG TPA: hypothetical protein VGZ03_08280 [Acidimicrobiales bacterium]|jgi:hypothetical protein|nr:hypothetical protein [Acidimicrobiales bacterium]
MAHDRLELRPRDTGDDDEDVAITIECDRCALQGSSACRGCLVSFVLDRAPGDAVIIDADEARALRVLTDAGLLPASRFEASAS